MPSKILISVQTDDGPFRDLHTIRVPDLPPDEGVGSRLRAELLAATAAGVIAEAVPRETAGA